MQERNLDLEIGLTRDQWQELGRRAAALGAPVAGYEWAADLDRILVYLTDEEARGLWSSYVSDEGFYGEASREVAQFVYNDGRPFAHLEAIVAAQPPALQPQQVQAMSLGLERFIREKWQRLLREAGIHYERGHVSPEAT